MGLRTYALALGGSPTRLSDVYGGSPGVADPALDIPYRQLTLTPVGAAATLGDATVTPTRGLVLSAAGTMLAADADVGVDTRAGASPYAQQVIADGASHYWRLGEASGTTAADLVGGAPGTISGGVTLGQPGPLVDGSKAMTFDGTTGKVVMPVGAVVFQPTLTFEAWAKTTLLSQRVVISGRTESGFPTIYILGEYNSGPVLFYPPSVSGVVHINDGVWHHLVATLISGVSWQIYLDGVLDASGSTGADYGTTSGGQLSIGWDLTDGQGWQGSVAEVAVYPTALSAAQIANHYALRTAVPTGSGGTAPLHLGPFSTGPLKLSQLYALGAGATLTIAGVPY